jgi:dTDP-4-amino-4,6-dideoxygalactose transaminase
MLVTDDLALAERARVLRSHGLSIDTWGRHHGAIVHDYDVVEPGFNLRLDEPRAALGTRLLARLDVDNRRRAELAERYVDALGDVEGACPVFAPERDVTCPWHIFPLLLRGGVDRTAFRARMHQAGVQTSALPAAAPDDRVFGGFSVRIVMHRKVWTLDRHSASVRTHDEPSAGMCHECS